MENIIYDDSPLAAYLEGEGKADATGWIEARDNGEVENEEYAPRGPSLLRERLRDRLPQPLSLNIPKNSGLAKIHHACSRAVNSRLNRADNAKFLEHFRYTIIASQLVSEHTAASAWKSSIIPISAIERGEAPPTEYKDASTSISGAIVTGVTAFAL
ncbi:hypothetical protein LTS18_001963, partial [Coniosporium uncinatum]